MITDFPAPSIFMALGFGARHVPDSLVDFPCLRCPLGQLIPGSTPHVLGVLLESLIDPGDITAPGIADIDAR